MNDITSRQLTEACAAALTGNCGRLVELADRVPSGVLPAFCARHGIHALIHLFLSKYEPRPNKPEWIRALKQLAHLSAANSLLHEEELKKISAALDSNEIPCLVFKGVPLAYRIYPSPALRPRADIDLLFPQDDVIRARQCLIGLGYRCEPLVVPFDRGVFLTTQSNCIKQDNGNTCIVDAHWRLNNSMVFADAMPFELLYRSARLLTEIPGRIRAPSEPHCLLIACFHRATELPNERLIWLYDLHLLVQRLSETELSQTADLAIDSRTASVLHNGLDAARTVLGTPIDSGLLNRLASAGSRHREPAMRVLMASGRLRRRAAEFRSIDGWRGRCAMLWSFLFPPRSYLELQGMDVEGESLPWLYLKRLANGLLAHFSHHSGTLRSNQLD